MILNRRDREIERLFSVLCQAVMDGDMDRTMINARLIRMMVIEDEIKNPNAKNKRQLKEELKTLLHGN